MNDWNEAFRAAADVRRQAAIGAWLEACTEAGHDVIGPRDADGFDWCCHSAAELLREALAAGGGAA